MAGEDGFQFTTQGVFEEVKKVAEDTSRNFSSMLQSIRRGERTEIDSMNGKTVEKGKTSGIKTPVNETLVRLIRVMEEHKRGEL